MDFHIDFDELNKISTEYCDINDSCECNDYSDSIAIIGIHANIGSAKSTDEVWEAFKSGSDMITDLPEMRRRDVQNYAETVLGHSVNSFPQKAYLENIDSFDANFFHISPVEAELMDPVQRIYLESAWSALEDAGYSAAKLNGSKTGVYVGYNSSGHRYEDLMKQVDEDLFGLAVSGNVDSIIASRLSYLMNLKGPAIMIDTACSSSLVALHQACSALKNHEITMAIVGGIRIFLCPEYNAEGNMGILSTSERTKTFDESADGTGSGEGVINFVLKPYELAKEDNDHIYAVIRSSSINQDGASLGITAPNLSSQKEVIIDAWKKANIDPNDISYIEAHGTATKLGDPIEVGALDKAFSEFTSRKQFCAIGAAKSNFGHLDCAAGLLGVLKVVLMMKYSQIPPSVHFNIPNKKIDYTNSAIYVNDKLREWNSENSKKIAGINSFGISGTNCHIVLEEVPIDKNDVQEDEKEGYLLALSARDMFSLSQYINNCKQYISTNPDVDFKNFCYTMLTGRDQYSCRFAKFFKSVDDFLKIDISEIMDSESVSEINIVHNLEQCSSRNITEKQKEELNLQASRLLSENINKYEHSVYERLIELFLNGADVVFETIFYNQQVNKISAPTYPFLRKRFWIESKKETDKSFSKSNYSNVLHPLVDSCIVDTDSLRVYQKLVSLKNCNELIEHKIGDKHVMPGTVYVEMAYAIAIDVLKTSDFTIKDVMFLSLLTCSDNEEVEIHSIVEENENLLTIRIVSRTNGNVDWTSNAKITISFESKLNNNDLQDINNLISKFKSELNIEANNSSGDDKVQLGLRWKNTKKAWYDDNSVLAYCKLSDDFEEERSKYYLYPALLDCAMNAGNLILSEFYLPFSYNDAVFYQNLPQEFYTYIHKKNSPLNQEIVFFEVEILDINGKVLGKVNEYTLKKVNRMEQITNKGNNGLYHNIEWKLCDCRESVESVEPLGKNVIVFTYGTVRENELISELKHFYGETLIVFKIDDDVQSDCYDKHINISTDSYDEFFSNVDFRNIAMCLDITTLDSDSSSPRLSKKLEVSFKLLKSVCKLSDGNKIKLFFITNNAHLINDDTEIIPENNAIIGMYTCADLEYSNVNICCIDTDESTPYSIIVNETAFEIEKTVVAYRDSCKYVEILKNITQPSIGQNMDVFDEVVTAVIVGGTGGIGLAICEMLSSMHSNLNLILLGRRSFEELESIKRDKIEKMRRDGRIVEVHSVDISDKLQTDKCFDFIRDKFGNIDAIVMAAGVPGGGILINKDWADFYKIISSKCLGVWNVHEATLNDNLKCFIMFSSFTSALGSPSQSDYTAANSYIDAFNEYRLLCGLPTKTINWTGWRESGMAFDSGVDEEGSLLKFLDDYEGVNAFNDILQLQDSRVLVGEFNYRVMNYDLDIIHKRMELDSDIKRKVLAFSQEDCEVEDLIISGKSVEKITDVERNVAIAWAKTLKVTEVNIYDKFFESGGNSLLATFLQKELDKVYPGAVAITDVFIYSTIAEIATMISNKIGVSIETNVVETTNDDIDIEKLVQQYVDGTINIDDVENLI